MNISNLLFRRQFVFAPEEIASLEKWKCDKLSNGYYISVHPDLQYTCKQKGMDYIVCLGYILDPQNPSWSDIKILDEFFRLYKTSSELTEYMNGKGGRYVIIASLNNEFIIFSDPVGFRQVFYMTDSSSKIWCASQPTMLAEKFGLRNDLEIEKDLLSIPLFTKTNEYWYPGRLTAYKEISHLTPNHYIDMGSGKQIRFWPKNEIENMNIEKGLENTSDLIFGLIQSAYRRFNMALAITSGLDSRILLAGCRNVKNDISYITHTHPGMNENSSDIRIPSLMLKELGLKHEVIVHSNRIDPDFEKYYRRNVSMARKSKGINAYSIFGYLEKIKKEMVIVNGVCGEITRHFYFLPKLIAMNGKSLAALAGMSGSNMAEEQFEKWLTESKDVSKKGVSLLDLFYWEQRLGNWAAMSYSEYDIAFESFSPMNCRKMLQCVLEIDAKYRKPPDYLFHRLLIKKMWPKIAQYSINPNDNILSVIKTKMKRTMLHQVYKTIKYIPSSNLFYNNGKKFKKYKIDIKN